MCSITTTNSDIHSNNNSNKRLFTDSDYIEDGVRSFISGAEMSEHRDEHLWMMYVWAWSHAVSAYACYTHNML